MDRKGENVIIIIITIYSDYIFSFLPFFSHFNNNVLIVLITFFVLVKSMLPN